MQKFSLLGISIIVLAFFLFPATSHAKPPHWVSSRPISPDFYIGIAACNKKETPDDCRKVAENKALFNLSSEISVDISGAFVDKIVERTGLSEQDVRMEVRAASRAHLTGHERVAEWEDRNEYWVYFRLSKAAYSRIMAKERETAVAAALDMISRALDAVKTDRAVSALRFYFEALARVQDFLGENLPATIQGRSTFLFNEIYAGIQNLMANIRLAASRERIPALIGQPLRDAAAVRATLMRADGSSLEIAGLPIRFELPWRSGKIFQRDATDDRGLAALFIDAVTNMDDGRAVTARVDVDALCPQKDVRGFFRALIQKLSIPESGFEIQGFEDKAAYGWHREFEGRRILIATAYQTREAGGAWPKIHDELAAFAQSHGAKLSRLNPDADIKDVIQLSKTPTKPWPDKTDADLILVAVADGRFNKRDNPENPFGEDVQFAGEIRTIAVQNGKPVFSDRYKGATGWNPMGEEMVLDVLAIHVFKRWQAKYLESIISDE